MRGIFRDAPTGFRSDDAAVFVFPVERGMI